MESKSVRARKPFAKRVGPQGLGFKSSAFRQLCRWGGNGYLAPLIRVNATVRFCPAAPNNVWNVGLEAAIV